MSLTTDFEIKNIKEYARLLRAIYDKQMELSLLKDELINLSCCMSQEDINEAQALLERQYQKDNSPENWNK